MPIRRVTIARLRCVLPLLAALAVASVSAAQTPGFDNPLRMPGAGALSTRYLDDSRESMSAVAFRPLDELAPSSSFLASSSLGSYDPRGIGVAHNQDAWLGADWPAATVAQGTSERTHETLESPTHNNLPTTIADFQATGYGVAAGGVRSPYPKVPCPNRHTLQVLPPGLMYTSYLAGVREPRFASQWVSEATRGGFWDIALGGRVAVLRWGTADRLNPQGCEVQMEGAAFPRLARDYEMELIACDYRFGIPLAFARGPHRYKIGYYHLCSHLGDEWMLRYPELVRINYVRDSMVVGYSFYATPDLRLYAEAACAFGTDGGAKPWEFQFGIDYSPAQPTGPRPVPFMAINGHLREEVDFGGNVTTQVGWQWRGVTGNLLRMGLQCFVGKSEQFEFWNEYESKLGFGMWYDF